MNSTEQSAGAQDSTDTRMPPISPFVAGCLLGVETKRLPGRQYQKQTPLLQELQVYLIGGGATIEQVAQMTSTSINKVARATFLYPIAGGTARTEDYNPNQGGAQYLTAYCYNDAIFISGFCKLPPVSTLWKELDPAEQAVARDAVRLLDCAEGMMQLDRDAERVMLVNYSIKIQADGQTLSKAARAAVVQLRGEIEHLKENDTGEEAERIIKYLPRRLAAIGCTRQRKDRRGAE